MDTRVRLLRAGLAAALVLAGAGTGALAQSGGSYPAKSVRIVVPLVPGGQTDFVARHLAERMSRAHGQPFLVDNRPGANGQIALDIMTRTAPDGYTLFVGNVSTNPLNEAAFPNLRVRPSRDLAGITNLIEVPHVIVVPSAFAPRDIRQLQAFVRANPAAKIAFGSTGIGSYPHIDMERFRRVAGLQNMVHVPYKGAGQALPGILGNEVQLMFLNFPSARDHLLSGRLHALATTWNTRLPDLPGVATVAEQGFAGAGTNAWHGLFAPAKVPLALIARLFDQVVAVMGSQESRDALAKQQVVLRLNASPAEFQGFVVRETERWSRILKDEGIKVEE